MLPMVNVRRLFRYKSQSVATREVGKPVAMVLLDVKGRLPLFFFCRDDPFFFLEPLDVFLT